MDKLRRKTSLGILLAATGMASAPLAFGQSFPSKPVRIVVPYGVSSFSVQ